jgi:hypothetical protein
MKRFLALAAIAGIMAFVGCDLLTTAKPTVAIVYPENNDTVGIGSITIKATATDDNGSVTQVEFFDGSTSIGVDNSGTSDTFSVVWASTAGAHTLKATATNDAGKTASHSINITVSAGGTSGPTYHHGDITQSETWYPAGNPHIITGDVSVQDASNSPILTIMPGCVVEFQGDYEIYTGYTEAGAIVAEGKPDSIILFTTTANPKTPGSWDAIGVYYRATSATSFKYCTFEYGGSNAGRGTFYVQNTSVKFENNTVSHSGSGGAVCSAEGYFSQFSGNTFSDNAGHAIDIDPDYVRLLGGSNTFTGNTNNDILVRGGEVTTTGTWLNQGAPYVIGGDISVQDASNSPVLTIAPACSLKFNGDYELYTGYTEAGAIVANGTAAQLIVFTTNVSPKAPGSWDAVSIYYRATAATSFEYCTFEYGGSNAGRGAFYVDGAHPTVEHCTITQSASDGVYLQADGYFASFTSNTVSNCGAHAVELYPEHVKTLGSANLFTGNTNNDILVHSGEMTTSGTWLNHGIPYVLAGDVNVQDDANNPVLTIAAGTTVKFQADAELYCGYTQPGGIIADGTSGEITFTSSVPTPSRGDWASISFYYRAISAQSMLKNCRIEYAGSHEGNIYIHNAAPTITGCNIGHSESWGIFIQNGSTVYPNPADLLANNTFYDNPSGSVHTPTE